MSDLYREGMLVVVTYKSGATVQGRLVESSGGLGISLTRFYFVWVCRSNGILMSPDDITEIKVIEAFPQPTGLGAIVVIPHRRSGGTQRVMRDWSGRWVTEHGEYMVWHQIAPNVISVITQGSGS